jgi:hypothetical protein
MDLSDTGDDVVLTAPVRGFSGKAMANAAVSSSSFNFANGGDAAAMAERQDSSPRAEIRHGSGSTTVAAAPPCRWRGGSTQYFSLEPGAARGNVGSRFRRPTTHEKPAHTDGGCFVCSNILLA